jgi:hypothetical protein
VDMGCCRYIQIAHSLFPPLFGMCCLVLFDESSLVVV